MTRPGCFVVSQMIKTGIHEGKAVIFQQLPFLGPGLQFSCRNDEIYLAYQILWCENKRVQGVS